METEWNGNRLRHGCLPFQVDSCAWDLAIHGTVASCSVAGPPSGITRHAKIIVRVWWCEAITVFAPGGRRSPTARPRDQVCNPPRLRHHSDDPVLALDAPRRCLSGFRGVAAAARPHEPPSLNLVRSCAVVPLGQTSAQGTAEGPSPLVVSFWCLGPHADHDQNHHRVMCRTWSSASLIKRNGGGSFG